MVRALGWVIPITIITAFSNWLGLRRYHGPHTIMTYGLGFRVTGSGNYAGFRVLSVVVAVSSF